MQPGSKADEFDILGYGVMVTLQILVLSFLVRVRVSQQRASSKQKMLFCYVVFPVKRKIRLNKKKECAVNCSEMTEYSPHGFHII